MMLTAMSRKEIMGRRMSVQSAPQTLTKDNPWARRYAYLSLCSLLRSPAFEEAVTRISILFANDYIVELLMLRLASSDYGLAFGSTYVCDRLIHSLLSARNFVLYCFKFSALIIFLHQLATNCDFLQYIRQYSQPTHVLVDCFSFYYQRV